MGAFELSNKETAREAARDLSRVSDNVEVAGVSDTRRVKEECIIALKVYDSCRQQRRKKLQLCLIYKPSQKQLANGLLYGFCQ